MIIKYATVKSANPLKVKFTNEIETSEATYPKLKSYVPIVGDTVAILKDDNEKYLIIGGVD